MNQNTFFRFEFEKSAPEERIVKMEIPGKIRLIPEDIPSGALSVSFHLPEFTANSGEEGFFLLPSYGYNGHTVLTRFIDRPDTERIFEDQDLAVYAVGKKDKALVAIVTGMRFDYKLVDRVFNGKYELFPRFELTDGAYEPIEIEFFHLAGGEATPAGIARCYRKFQLDRGVCLPLRDRIETQPLLKKVLSGAEIRLRMAWKPVPPTVLEQTLENEPEVHVALPFARAEELLQALYKRGVRNAEFCLVGWNVAGHDGRFPDLLPVEPKLGGEQGLKKLLTTAKEIGFPVGAHTNLLDSYTIASRWRKEDTLKNKDGNPVPGGTWGGGQSYFLCPQAAFEHLLPEDLKTLQSLGFDGTHYFDVFTIQPNASCYDPEHPLNRRDAALWRGKILEEVRKVFGASSSEGSLDFAAGSLDYALYMIFGTPETYPEMCDEIFPFRHIVYHGIWHYNVLAKTVNAPVKQDRTLGIMNMALGGRPLYYYYSKFRENSPLGGEDLLCGNEEELRCGVEAVACDIERYAKFADLQYLFIEDILEIKKNIWITSYSDGTVTVGNATEQEFSYMQKVFGPFTLTRIVSDGTITVTQF